MSYWKLGTPPDDFKSEKKKFDEAVDANRYWPEVMKNLNFYNLFKSQFRFDYTSVRSDDLELQLIVELIENPHSKADHTDRIIGFIEKYIPSFGDLLRAESATVKRFKSELHKLVRENTIPMPENLPKIES